MPKANATGASLGPGTVVPSRFGTLRSLLMLLVQDWFEPPPRGTNSSTTGHTHNGGERHHPEAARGGSSQQEESLATAPTASPPLTRRKHSEAASDRRLGPETEVPVTPLTASFMPLPGGEAGTMLSVYDDADLLSAHSNEHSISEVDDALYDDDDDDAELWATPAASAAASHSSSVDQDSMLWPSRPIGAPPKASSPSSSDSLDLHRLPETGPTQTDERVQPTTTPPSQLLNAGNLPVSFKADRTESAASAASGASKASRASAASKASESTAAAAAQSSTDGRALWQQGPHIADAASVRAHPDEHIVVPLSACHELHAPQLHAPKSLQRSTSRGAMHINEWQRCCSECANLMTGAVFMLHDQSYCSADCRLQACKREAAGGVEGKQIHRSQSAQSMVSSSSSTGLYASFRSWI